MIYHTKSPLSSEEVNKIVAWVDSPPAKLVVRCIESKMDWLTAEIGRVRLEQEIWPKMEEGVAELITEYKKLKDFLDGLRVIKEKAGDLSINGLNSTHELSSRFATTGTNRSTTSGSDVSITGNTFRASKEGIQGISGGTGPQGVQGK